MNDALVLFGGVSLVLILLLTNAYWYRRERTVKRGLSTSRVWDEVADEMVRGADRRLREVASTLDASVGEVPERVAALDSKVRRLQSELDGCRERWSDITRSALDDEVVGSDGPLLVHIPGSRDDAAALLAALDTEGLTAVCGRADHSFVVRTPPGTGLSADAIARSAVAGGPGGAGGSETFAEGRGESGQVFEALESVCANRTGASPTVIRLDDAQSG